jgi:hypothetical protein
MLRFRSSKILHHLQPATPLTLFQRQPPVMPKPADDHLGQITASLQRTPPRAVSTHNNMTRPSSISSFSTYAFSTLDKDAETIVPSRRSSMSTTSLPPPPYVETTRQTQLSEQQVQLPDQVEEQADLPARQRQLSPQQDARSLERERTKAYMMRMAERETGKPRGIDSIYLSRTIPSHPFVGHSSSS